MADSDMLSVAVTQAINALRPQTTDSACKTSYSRVEDHFSRELIISLTKDDPHLSLIMDYRTTPRPESQKSKIRNKLPEHWRSVLPSLHVADQLLFLDERLVMPTCLQTPIISLLHSTHAGARAMISMAEFIWFPHMVRSIHSMTRACSSCTATGRNLTFVSAKAHTVPREPVTAPGDELDLDFWGPITSNPSSHMYVLVAVDRYSRFPFALCTSSPTADTELRFLTEFT